MQGIPKTYKFEKCNDFKEFCDIMKNNNAELAKYITSFHQYEFSVGQKLLIYKNDILIGYLCISPMINVILILKEYLRMLQRIKSQGKFDDDDEVLQYSFNKTTKYLQIFNNVIQYLNSNNVLDIGLLEIIKEHRSFNTIKIVFNYIKQYCINNNFNYAWCCAKNKSVGRLYQMAGFKYIEPINDNHLDMFLDINQKDYYEVTEKLKNKYKKNLFEIMKDNKTLYNKIMESVAKEVKKAINEGEDYIGYNHEEIDIQGDSDRWCEIVDEYLWENADNAAVADVVLALFSTLVYLDQLDDEEVKVIAERIMEQIDEDEEFDNPPVDEVFFEAVAEKLQDEASDWCAEVIRNWKLNQ